MESCCIYSFVLDRILSSTWIHAAHSNLKQPSLFSFDFYSTLIQISVSIRLVLHSTLTCPPLDFHPSFIKTSFVITLNKVHNPVQSPPSIILLCPNHISSNHHTKLSQGQRRQQRTHRYPPLISFELLVHKLQVRTCSQCARYQISHTQTRQMKISTLP